MPSIDVMKTETQNGMRLTEYSKWQIIREKRNRLLAESDWTQIPDVTLDEKTRNAWREYRQKLRDIPQQYTKADDIIWPEKPPI